MPKPELVDVQADLVVETAKAYKINDGKRAEFVPKSMVEYDAKTKTFTMPEWLAKEKGFI